MNCSEFDRLLNDHRVPTLSAPERSALALHLRECDRCADAWVGDEAVRSEAVLPVAPDLFERLSDHATESAGARRQLLPLGLAAATAIALVTLVAVLQPGADRGNPSEASSERVVAGAVDIEEPLELVGSSPNGGYQALPYGEPVAAAGRVQVAEFFMFDCIHCYNFEAGFGLWCQAQPDYVDVVRVPVLFNTRARVHARAYYTAQALGIEEPFREALFGAIHEQGQMLDTATDLVEFFARAGIASDRFERVFRSEEVERRLLEAEALAQRYRIQATPSLVVNGRYLTNPSLASSFDRMLEVADELVAAERASIECPRSGCPARPGL